MANTRVYFVDNLSTDVSLDPASNPLLKDIRAELVNGTNEIISSSINFGSIPGITPGQWFIVVTEGPNNAWVGTYIITSVISAFRVEVRNANTTIPTFTGTAGQKYKIMAFKGIVPSEYDKIPESFMFLSAPTTTFRFITADGQFCSFGGNNPFIVGGMYNISIRKIVIPGSAEINLFGTAGPNGSPLIA